jgi:hypothetical protein
MHIDTECSIANVNGAKVFFALPPGDFNTLRKILAMHIRLEYTTFAEARRVYNLFESLSLIKEKD